MASELIDYDDWIKHTNSIGHSRSTELKAVDDALRTHQKLGTDASRSAVGLRFVAFKLKQGGGLDWKKSRRNKDGYLDLLETLLTKGTDTDSAWGTTPDFMHPDLASARLGVLYLFSNLSVNPRLFRLVLDGGLGMAGSVVSYAGLSTSDGGLGNTAALNTSLSFPPTMVAGNDILDAGWGATKSVILKPDLATQAADFMRKIRIWFTDVAQRIIASLRDKWNCELPASAIKAAINVACSATLSVATAGLVSGALDLSKGAIVTVDAMITRIRNWRSSRDVEFASGHPTLVVESIHRAMTASIGEGLWTMLKGAGNMGLTAASAGAGVLAGVLIAGVEMLTKLFWRLFEVTRMNRLFTEAGELWRKRDSGSSLHLRPFAFSRWYRKHVLVTPALAVLTLNSGICGNKMTFLSMFADGDSEISGAAFKAGVDHLDGLKVWGVNYLKECGFSFSSPSTNVGNLVSMAQGGVHHVAGGDPAIRLIKSFPANLSGGAKAWDYLRRAATA